MTLWDLVPVARGWGGSGDWGHRIRVPVTELPVPRSRRPAHRLHSRALQMAGVPPTARITPTCGLLVARSSRGAQAREPPPSRSEGIVLN